MDNKDFFARTENPNIYVKGTKRRISQNSNFTKMTLLFKGYHAPEKGLTAKSEIANVVQATKVYILVTGSHYICNATDLSFIKL